MSHSVDKKNVPSGAAIIPANSAVFQGYAQALKSGLKQDSFEDSGESSDALKHSKDIEVVEEDGVVKKIIIRCKCGETHEIECDYS